MVRQMERASGPRLLVICCYYDESCWQDDITGMPIFVSMRHKAIPAHYLDICFICFGPFGIRTLQPNVLFDLELSASVNAGTKARFVFDKPSGGSKPLFSLSQVSGKHSMVVPIRNVQEFAYANVGEVLEYRSP